MVCIDSATHRLGCRPIKNLSPRRMKTHFVESIFALPVVAFECLVNRRKYFYQMSGKIGAGFFVDDQRQRPLVLFDPCEFGAIISRQY